VQRVKQTLGASSVYTGDQAGRLVTGSDGAAYVDVRPLLVRVAVTPTVSTTPAYTAKDAIGGLMTFANVVRHSGGSGTLMAVQVVDKDQEMKDADLVLFDRSIAASTDNAVFDPTDTELTQCVGWVPLGAGMYADFNDNSILAVNNIGLDFVSNGTSLVGQLVARGTPTFTATSDIVVTLTVWSH
jgi:hypothetical protein